MTSAIRDIIVIGASAGGIETLKEIVAGLPANLPAAVFVVLHTAPTGPGFLPQILSRAGRLPAIHATDNGSIELAHIYVAPPDHHLLVERGERVRVTRGPKENRFRPAVDPLFRSAAHACGRRVIGVVLTGYLDDGTAGLRVVKQLGGTAIVQDPLDAIVPSMPRSALRHVDVDHCLPASEIAGLLARLAGTRAEEGDYLMPEDIEIEVAIARQDRAALKDGVMRLGDPSPYTCPECHGTLVQLRDTDLLRFRCHTGHAFTVESLLAEIGESIEGSLWSTVRTIEESAMLMRQAATRLGDHDHASAAELFARKAGEAQERAEQVRQVVINHERMTRSDSNTNGNGSQPVRPPLA